MLTQATHRVYPPPANQWLMAQTWYDLLFMHWPVKIEDLRPLVPAFLEIDTFESTAWLGVVPFAMTDIHFQFLPPVPYFSSLLELNVRTYVTCRGKSGVYFLSLDASHGVAVEVARTFFCLPYFKAGIKKQLQDSEIWYHSQRTDRRAKKASLEVRYRPIGDVYNSSVGSLESWLTERYCFFAADRAGKPLVGEIHHDPWPLQKAEAEIRQNTMTDSFRIKLPKVEPLVHFAGRLETIEWAVKAVY